MLACPGELRLVRGMVDNSPRTLATYTLAGALVLLAGALVYFAVSLRQVAHDLPPVVEGLQEVAAEVPPILERVDVILEETVPAIMTEVAEVRGQLDQLQARLPDVLAEVATLRESTVPSVLTEMENIRASIPPILDRVAKVQEQIPSILDEVEAVRGEIPGLVDQVDGIREQIPAILAEVEAIRLAVPEYLDEANILTDKVRAAGKEAGEGAVQGLFTGILRAPVNLVAGLRFTSIAGQELTDQGRLLFQRAVAELLADPHRGASTSWNTVKGGVELRLTVEQIRGESPQRVVELTLTATRGRRVVDEIPLIARENESGVWDTQRAP